MADVLRINNETISSDAFIRLLKLSGRLDDLVDEIVREKLVIHTAKKVGIAITPQSLQERADQLRRVRGLHRAADMHRYLQQLKVSVEEYEGFVADSLYHDQMMAQVLSDAAVEQYFRLHSPKFDSIDVSHIVVGSAGQAREIVAVLKDDPEQFDELAREHSVADTRDEGGHIGQVLRESLQNEVAAKVFHAAAGSILGPFASPDGAAFEIFKVNARRAASFEDTAKDEIRRVMKEEWLAARAREHHVEVL